MPAPDRPLHVLLTTPNLDTAGSKYIVADLIEGFDRAAVRPSLCVQRKTNTELEKRARQYVDEFLELPLRIPTRPVRHFLKRTRQIADRLRNRFDVVHSFDYASLWSEGVIMKQAHVPWIIDKTNLHWGSWRWYLRGLLARRIVCKSHSQYAALFERGLFSKKATVVHNGIKIGRFDKQVDRATLAPAIRVPAEAIILGCVAHLVPVKGHVELLQAFAEVAVHHPSVYLVLIGAGAPEYEEDLQSLAKKLGLCERVRFLGRRSDVPSLMHLFDGLILATRDWGRKEAFGVVLVEAMACGLPVIATRSGGPEDIVVHQETGWLVSPQGIEPLVEAMRDFLSDGARRRQFGQAGKERAKQLFSLDTMIQRYQQVYREAL